MYALSAQGLTDERSPLRSVQEMAELYIEQIRTLSVEEGVLARRLVIRRGQRFRDGRAIECTGEEIASLILLDTYARIVAAHLPHQEAESDQLHSFNLDLVSSFGAP